MKRVLVICLIVICVFLFIPKNVSAATSGDYEYTDNGDGTCTITRYTGASVDITIPGNINGNIVTSINNYAFSSCTSLISVIMPDSITSIGNYTFNFCDNLTSISLSNNIINIGEYSFRACNSLTSIIIPDSATYIGAGAFRGCTSLTNIALPNSITEIEDSTFALCTSLMSVTISNNVINIGDKAFSGCSSLTDIDIPNSVESIGEEAFRDCSSLIDIVIPESIIIIEDLTFYHCSSLTSIIIPYNVVSIGISAFNGCNSLTSIIIPNSVTSIGISAFYSCNSLANIALSNSITKIDKDTFWNCSSLTSVTIPDSVTSIGDGAFGNCINLINAIIPNSVTSFGVEVFANCSSLISITIPESIDIINDYMFSGCSSLTSITIPNSVTVIRTNAFYDCSSLISITIPNSVTAIGAYAFYGCSSFSNIIISEGVTSIENNTFDSCSNLTSIIIPNNVTSIGAYAFSGCNSLTSIIIPNSVTSIGIGAFSCCGSLTSIPIPDSVTIIEDSTFNGCNNLTSVNIPSNITIIGPNSFSNCNNLTSITIPNSVVSIGAGAFSDCGNLTDIAIPKSVTSIEDNTFYRCRRLDNIIIPSNITEIGSYAFYMCDNLTSIIIPNSVTSIGNRAFYYCSGLENITISKNISIIGDFTFDMCTSLVRINIPDSVTFIGDSAFYMCINLTIYGYYNSYAESYAYEHGIPFVEWRTVIDSVISEIYYNNFKLIVLDSVTKQPVENAIINIIDLGEATTNSDGIAVFDVSSLPDNPVIKQIQISKEGYLAITKNIVVEKGKIKVEFLPEDDIEPHVVEFSDIDNNRDMINETWTFYEDSEAERVTTNYKLSGVFPDSSAKEYRIIQSGEIKSRSTDGYFEIDFSKDFSPGYKIYVQVVDNEGKASSKIETSIKIYGENQKWIPNEADTIISFGKKSSFVLAEDLPLVGGTSVEIGWFDEIVPFTLEVDNDLKVKFTMGTTKNYDQQKMELGIVTAGYNKYGNVDWEGLTTALATEYSGAYGLPLKAYVLGVGEGYYEDETFYLDCEIVIGVKGTLGTTLYTFVGVVPFYADLSLSTNSTFTGGLKFQYNEITGITIAGGDLEVKPNLCYKVGVGVGIPKVASVGGSGNVEFEYLHRFIDKYNKVDVTISADFSAYLLFKELATLKCEGQTYQIAEWYGDEEPLTSSPSDTNTLYTAIRNTSNYETIPRVAEADVILKSSIYGDEIDILEANTFQNAMPQMILHNGTPYIFWLSDDLERPVQNRSMLVYSKQESGVWSAPVAVEDDETADGYFDVVSDTNGIYVVWHDSKTTFEEDATLEDSMAASEINMAFIDDATQSIAIQNITDNEYMDTVPQLSVVNNNGIVTWASNDENNIFMDTGTNTIYRTVIISGIAGTAETVETTTDAAYNLNAGYLNSQHVIAYVKDTDNDLSTIEDTDIYVKAGEGAVYNFTDNDTADTNVYFRKLNSTENLFWYADGDICYLSNLADTPDTIFGDAGISTDRFEVITDGSTSKLIWNEAIESGEEMITALYACDYIGVWSKPYMLAELGAGATLPTGYIDTDSKLSYLISNGTGMDLVAGLIDNKPNLSITRIDMGDVVPEASLSLDVYTENIGMTDISALDVNIYRNETLIYSSTVTQDMLIGEAATVSITDFIVPADTSLSDTYRVEITVTDDLDTTDNSMEFKLGYCDVQMETDRSFHEGEHLLTVYLENSTVFPTGGTLYIRENDSDGAVLYEETIDEANNSEVNAVIINLSEIDSITEAPLLYLEFVCGVEDKQLADNYEYQYVADPLDGNGDFAALTADYARTHCSTIYESDGSITLSAEYGSGYYEFSIDGGTAWQDSNIFDLLSEGEYEVYIRDREENFNIAQVSVYMHRADYNNDNAIDMLDLIIAAQAYNGTAAEIDLNGDVIVNLFDLIIISRDLS